MKNLKKIMAAVLAVMMVSAMAVTAFAATITIKQTAPAASGTVGAETYALYKIFDVKKTSDQSGTWAQTDDNLGSGTETGFAYTISTSNPWYSVVSKANDWVTLTQSAGDTTVYNVTWKGANNESAAKAFADWLLSKKGDISADKTMVSSSGTATETVEDGYYLITSTIGTNLVLATSDITISTKNQYITDDKTVAKTNYNVGDMVPYTITVNLPASIDYTKPVIVHDTMDDVLALDTESVHAKVTADNDFDSHLTLVQSSSFDANHSASHAAAGKILFDFVLDINSLVPATGSEPEAKTITITYEAELLEAAAADNGLVNEEFTEYSKYTTVPNEAKIKTFDFDLEKKFKGTSGTDLVATFNLYGSSGSSKGSKIKLIEESIYNNYVKADSKTPSSGTETEVISVKIGTKLNVRGLAEGTYYLTELTTAEGYNLLTEDVVVVIDGSGTVSIQKSGELFSASSGTITVVNKSGSVLPSTGGIGTTIFYVVGAVLVIGSGIVLVTKKRMGKEEN